MKLLIFAREPRASKYFTELRAENAKVIDATTNLDAIYSYIKTRKFRVILICEVDNYSIIELVRSFKSVRRDIIAAVLLRDGSQRVPQAIVGDGADYIMYEPLSTRVIYNSLCRLENGQSENRFEEIADYVRILLAELGLMINSKGFCYIAEAIEMGFEDEECLTRVTTHLYPQLAKRHKASAASVERAIRNAVQKAYHCRMKNSYYTRLLLPPNDACPTNSEFLVGFFEHTRERYAILNTDFEHLT